MRLGLDLARSTLVAMVAAASCCAGGAAAQSYPDRPVRMIIPYSPGGATDVTGRAVAAELAKLWKQPVVLDHRPGASTLIGAEAAAKAPADGYTLLYSDNATFVVNAHLFGKMPLDPLKDLAPIALAIWLAPVLAVSSSLPVSNVAEFIAYAKGNPDKVSYASVGPGTYPHIAMEYFNQLAGVKMLHVPYKGTAPALVDMIAGRVHALVATLAIMEQHEKQGGVKVIAAAGERRLAARPNMPTVAESLPGFAISTWFGLAAPAGTPAAILDKINADTLAVMKDPEFREKFLMRQSLEGGSDTRAEFARRLQADFESWGRLVKASGAKLD